MKIGLFVRTDQASKPGGDAIQATAYARALGSCGVEARLIASPADLDGLDLLHVFNVDRPWDCLGLARAAHRRGIAVVLSPIAHPREALLRYQATRSFPWERRLLRLGLSGDTSERLKALARALANRNATAAAMAVALGAGRAKRMLWRLTSGIQLLSLAEKAELERQGFSFAGRGATVVRNGVTPPVSKTGIPLPELEKFSARNPRFAVVGGRIEPRKNQLEILRVAAEAGIPTVFAGAENRRHRQYCRDFQAEVSRTGAMLHVGAISRDDFARLLERAHMHVSASLFEVSPLVDLEARAVGRRVVATASSFGVEFLDEHATVCDPWERASIAAAIKTAWDLPRDVPRMAVPSWEDTAQPLLTLYRDAQHHHAA